MNVDEFKCNLKDKKSGQATQLARWTDFKTACVLLEKPFSVLAKTRNN